ncbi:M48 family metallopeptidase [Herbaspirillum sp. SJZ107]|uniref:M48 family metallopeptidase n=1 Tax=Herbaspirillum sp. SJZ107 TaxID=2572881 RepID=UPI001152E7D0|nr:M48 family metallopeptidase [Herbaspirillum sp. SJZ107]TQK07691.1 peptidase M48-like protein [Herbaspirillum sp. SJZ107]
MTNASYFDGHNPRMQPVTLTVDAGRLHIAGPGLARSVPLGTVRPGERFARAPLVLRLDGGACCEVAPGPACGQLLAAIGHRESLVARWHARRPLALLALPVLVLLLALLYLRGLPLVAKPIAATLPLTVDRDLGKAELDGLEAEGELRSSRLPDARVAEVTALLPPLLPAHPRLPVRLLVRDGPEMGANAYALADGTIVVSDDLVRLFQTGDGRLDAEGKAALMGILGHEVGHLEHRHKARMIAVSSLGTMLSATLFGDISAVAAALPARLARMHYSRDMEREADAYAAEVLRRQHLSVRHFTDALSRLEEAEGDTARLPRWVQDSMGYLSTHPGTTERIRRLQEIGEADARAFN